MSWTVRGARSRALTATAVAAVVAGFAYAPLSDATAASPELAGGVTTTSHDGLLAAAKASPSRPRVLGGNPAGGEPGSSPGLPEGVPTSGHYAFLLRMKTKPTMAAFSSADSVREGRAAAKAQLAAVRSAQASVVAALPAHSTVLYKTHAVLAGVAVSTDVSNYQALRAMKGVVGVYPIAAKSPSNSYAVPLQNAPKAWKAYGDLGANSTVAIIDTGIDYTHANMGGVGTVADFDAATAQDGQPVSAGEFPGGKVIGGFDLAGDDYQADPNSPNYNPVPTPDPYPLDCNGHGSHVAGTVAGYGENADGSTYTGAYNNNTPFDTMKIGPGVAPEAKLYGFRVFGCAGSTDLVSAAIDMAADPNGDGDPSDHADVVNMSLGSDFGSPQDGDSVVTQAATELGITMAVASGNAGDLYDAGGSPGDVSGALTVAASTDNSAVVDALNVTAPAAIAGAYAAERSIAYDYTTKPDLSGNVARVTQATNLDGCLPLNAADAAAVNGKIAFVEWTDDDTIRRCGSAARAANLAAAGASGFIYANDEESFAAGITGSAVIPGVLVAKSGGDAMRPELVAGHTVTIGSTTQNGFTQLASGRDDLVAAFSSRGIGDADNVKPDVTAVGESVFSTGVGTGTGGLNDSGTSMATPMVAGTAALVKSQHADWTAEQVKADIMNTAEQDLFTDLNHNGKKYGPQRVGSGRIDVKKALDNQVLAYNAEDHGAVSVSFGPQAVTAPTTLTKTIKVQNTGLSSVTYAVSFDDRTKVPGADYSVSPSTVTVGARSSKTVTVTLTLDPTQLTKTIDPTVDRDQGGNPRVYQADASGLVVLKSAGQPRLRVPVYAAPRPASDMTQASTFTLPEGAHQSALLPLTGTGVSQGSGKTEVDSLVSGFELAATSPAIPVCAAGQTSGCVDFADEGTADIRTVGITSDAAQVTALGGDPATDGTTYIAVQANQPWRTPVGIQEFDIFFDTDQDGTSDFVTFNTRLTGTDVLVAETIDLVSGDVVDVEPINAALGDTDTALLQSNVLVLPVFNAALGIDPADGRFDYGVFGFTGYLSDPLDTVGVDGDDVTLSFDPVHPGAAAYGTVDASSSLLLFQDSPASVLKVDRDAAAYAADKAQGLMMVHFHNGEAGKVQVVSLNKFASTTALALNPTSVAVGSSSTATVTVAGGAVGTPTGSVTLKDGATTVGTAALNPSGTATFPVTPTTAGTHNLTATYGGDDNYAGSSASGTLTVTSTTPPPPTKVTPSVSLTLNKSSVKRGHKVKASVGVTGSAGMSTGTVELGKIVDGTFKVVATGTLSNGTLTLKYVPTKAGKYLLQARYGGDSAYTSAASAEVKLKVTKK
jgi:subtilisin family serine protease